jgi:hypothetical protein
MGITYHICQDSDKPRTVSTIDVGYNTRMLTERDIPSEDPAPKEVRTFATSVGLGGAILLASGVTFLAAFTLGTIVGTRVSAAGGPFNEHHLGDGVATGVVAGSVCSLTVAVLLFRWLFGRPAKEEGREPLMNADNR